MLPFEEESPLCQAKKSMEVIKSPELLLWLLLLTSLNPTWYSALRSIFTNFQQAYERAAGHFPAFSQEQTWGRERL